MSESETQQDEYITVLNKNDVLCGRGSGPNERAGNINFRDLVVTRKLEQISLVKLLVWYAIIIFGWDNWQCVTLII